MTEPEWQRRRFPKRIKAQSSSTDWLGLHALVVDGMGEHRRLEEYGLELLKRAHFLLRDVLFERPETRTIMALGAGTPPGPDFAFGTSYSIFGGRIGSGPLYVAWDTNILLYYFEYGPAIWTDGRYPEELDDELQSELECLQLIFALWVIRDVRFIVLPEVLDDAKKKLTHKRRQQRVQALMEFTQALQLVEAVDPHEDEISREGLLQLPDSVKDAAIANVPTGLDQRMVTAAFRRGVHVFLTGDKGVQRAARALHPFGLSIYSPGDLFEELVAAGAFNCIFNTKNAYWPLPDQQRVAHLIRALPNYEL